MIDLHCHLLPGLDDGPATMDESIELAAAQVSAGIDTVVATPHVNSMFCSDRETIVARIVAGVAAVNTALADYKIVLGVMAGAEIDLQYGLNLDDGSLRALALGRGPWLLIEAPHQLHPGVETEVLELIVRGHRVLLAHPERSPVFLRDPKSLRRLVNAGVRTQITAGALVGRFGGTVERYVEDILRAGIVHTVASDAHNTARRPPGLHMDILNARFGDGAMWLTREAPRIILDGGELPAVTHLAPRRHGGWQRLTPRLRRGG